RHLRTRGGVRISQDVEGVDAVPAVHLDLLENETRRDAEALVGREFDRGAYAGARAGVVVLLDVRPGLDRGHVAGVAVVIHRQARGRPVAHGDVRAKPDLGAGITVAA